MVSEKTLENSKKMLFNKNNCIFVQGNIKKYAMNTNEFAKGLVISSSMNFENGGGVDIIAPFGTLVSKNKQQKLEYKKVGSNFEFMIYEGVNNPVSNYSRTSFKKSKNGSIIMNYNEFLKFIYSKGFVDDQKYID
jgi:hypothetical protein